jgi:hypothetical protein
MADKVLIANVLALKKKYGPKGYRKIRGAIMTLIAADELKGLTTQFIDISNSPQMKKYRAPAVSNPRSEAQSKNAVDRIYAVVKPQYLVLIDGPDVIPHIRLKNPTPGDKDPNVPSDLPYASDEPLSRRDAASYAAVTRVVGRIPGITGVGDPSFLVSQIKTAAGFKSRKRDEYLSHFAISTYAWRKSTQRSVENIFRSKPIKLCPPTDSPGTSRMLRPLSHFINCHGGEIDPQFYGQRGNQYPISLTSNDVVKGARRNTVVAAECCYGAQLFNPEKAHGKWPISNAYLSSGAVAFFGSTTTAYGPSEGNGSADLITQYFLIDVLAAASVGRACLQARQKFVHGQKMEDPVNLKTLAQFILLGDPSLQPVRGEAGTDDDFLSYLDFREARRVRRAALAASGKSAVDCSGFPGRQVKRGRTKLHRLVHRIARQKDFKTSLDAIEAYEIVGRDNYADEMKRRRLNQKVFMATHREVTQNKPAKGVPLTRILVAHAQSDRLVGVFEYVRR